MADTIIIAPTTSAAQSAGFTLEVGEEVTVYVYPVASLTASQYADLERKDPAGTWQNVHDVIYGGQVRLDTAVTDITVIAPGTYRINKDASTGAIGVALTKMRN